MGVHRARSVATGTGHVCFLIEDGSVQCLSWPGAAGCGTYCFTNTVTDVVSLYAGQQHTCAIRTGGTVTCVSSRVTGSLLAEQLWLRPKECWACTHVR